MLRRDSRRFDVQRGIGTISTKLRTFHASTATFHFVHHHASLTRSGPGKRQRRGVVVLTTANDVSCEAIGWTLLQRLPLKGGNTNEFAKEIVGLGFAFGLDKKTHTLLVTKVYPKSPAAQAGLSSGLIIQKINAVPTTGKSIAECFNLLRANGSPKVRLELVNQERKETNTVELTRGKFLTSG